MNRPRLPKLWLTGKLKERKNGAVPEELGKWDIYSHEWKRSKNGWMEQPKTMEYGSRKASPDVSKLHIFRESQEQCTRFREGVPYVKVYRYNPKHLCPNLNGYGDNGQRIVWSSRGSTHCTCQLTVLSIAVLECGVIWRQFSSRQP